jgi:hypothetical protein
VSCVVCHQLVPCVTNLCRVSCVVSGVVWHVSGGLKSVDRSVEKLARVYKGNVSLLLDVVRQCIVFQSVTDMLEALRIIKADVDVDVVRIKNRMCKRYRHQTKLITVTKLNSLLSLS